MKKHFFTNLAKLILFAAVLICCSNAYAAQKCGIRVGYTKFANASGATGAFCTNLLLFEGTANESMYSSFGCGDPTGAANLNQNNYTIVQSTGNFGSNGTPTINYTPATGGGLYVVNTYGNQDFAVYAIDGLTNGETYTVRVVLVGLSDVSSGSWCDQQIMRPQIYVTRPGGVSTSGGGLSNGSKRTLAHASGCTNADGFPTGGTNWDINNGGNQTLNPNGHRVEFTCDVRVGGNNVGGGNSQWADTGFEIHFKYPGNQNQGNQWILGIEEIEITGCVEQEIISSQGINPCEGSPTTLSAGGLGMTTDVYEWSVNGTIISGETGYRITVVPPVGTTTTYTVRNVGTNAAFWNPPAGYLSLAVTPANCCGAAATRFTVPKVCSPPSITSSTATDAAWNMAPWTDVDKNIGIDGNAPNCPGTAVPVNPAGRWRSVYDDDYIYFLVQLYGPAPLNNYTYNGSDGWGASAVEIYLANNNINPGNAQTQQKQFGFGINSPNGNIIRYAAAAVGGAAYPDALLFQELGSWYFKTRIPLTANGYSPNNPYMYMELTINQSVNGNCRISQTATWNPVTHHWERADSYTEAPFSSCASVVAVPDTICAGESVNLSTQMTAAGGTDYTWEQSLNETGPWTPIYGTPAPSTTNTIEAYPTISGSTVMTSGTIYYRAIHGGVATCPAKVVVQPSIAVANPVGASICAGETAQIKADVASGTVSWYAASSGGTALGTSASGALWTTPTLYTNTTFYAEATNNTCPSAARVAVLVTVTPENTITLTSDSSTLNQSICFGEPITSIVYTTTGATGVTVTGWPNGLMYAWSVGSGAIGTLTIYGTPTSTAGSPFNFIVTLTGGCGDVTATGTIVVNPIPVVTFSTIPSGVAHLSCAVASIDLTASGAGTGGTYSWNTGANTASINVTTAGTYIVTATNAGGCSKVDSIVITQDNNMPVISVSGTTTVCDGASTVLTASGATTYTWTAGGFSATGASVTLYPTTTTTYTVTGDAGAGCTGTTTVTVVVKPTYNGGTDAVTICETELPYTYPKNGQVFTTGGSHQVNFSSVDGCDSIITLTINVTPVAPQFDTQNVCKADLPYRYQNAAFGIDTLFNTNTISGNYVFNQNCGSMTLTLDILDAVNSEKPVFPNICADDGFFYIQVEPTGAAGDVVATDFEIIFPAGSFFADKQGEVEGGNKIRVDIPADIYPDVYTCTIKLKNPISCADKEFVNVTFDVYYPNSIMQQKWNNVIALYNEYYNGGYQYTGYQWFKNGAMLPGETNSYIYIGAGEIFNLTDEYYVQLTRIDGSKMFSCPIELEERSNVSVYPTIVSGGGNITIYSQSPRKAVANIYTVTGILVGAENLSEALINTIAAPTQQGTYLLEIRTQDNSERQVVPIVVSRQE